MYPRFKYHPEKEAVIVRDAAHEESLGSGWFESPAEFGVETCPNHAPDKLILAKKEAFDKSQVAAAPVETNSGDAPKRGRPRK